MKVTSGNFRKYESYALVTGAASGMGRIYSIQLALRGYCLILVDIDGDGLQATAGCVADALGKVGDFRRQFVRDFRIRLVTKDLSRPEAASELAAETDAAGCEVELLVNNAGLFFFQDIVKTPPQKLGLMMMVHNYTPLMLCREFVPKMQERGRGYVLNISSLAAWMPWPAVGMYSNTKRFIKGFSRSLRVECRGTGVSVTTAYFGAVDTPLFPLSPSLRKVARGLGVMITPEKAVDAALRATFRRRKGTMPGLLNHVFRPVVAVLPDCVLAVIDRLLSPIKKKY